MTLLGLTLFKLVCHAAVYYKYVSMSFMHRAITQLSKT